MMSIPRRKTKTVKIGKVFIGTGYPVAIQSMAKTKTADIEKTTRQIKQLQDEGCEIVRVAVKDSCDAKAISKIKDKIDIPLVADIHFDWRLAIEAIDHGADKIRLNPGNIYKKDQLREIARVAKIAGIPIRVGLNSGSIGHCRNQAERMVKMAKEYIKILEGFKFYNLVVSLKASNIFDTVEAYRRLSRIYDYPLHLGVTATGPTLEGAVKSSIALGILLSEGIGDTLRVSLTAKPQLEIKVARHILGSLGLRNFGPQIISCPTCGRCEIDLVKIVENLDKRLSTPDSQFLKRPLSVAVMGCVVNGPGEAREADIGVAFGRKEGLLFKNGRAVRKVSLGNCADILLKEMERLNG